MTPRGHLRARGGALLAVLWLSAGLSAIALSVSTSVRSATERVSSSADGLRASYLATGALERAILWLQWGANFTNPDGTRRFWGPGVSRLTMAFPSGDALVEVIPEAAKLNINTATRDDLYRVVFAVTGDPGRSDEIAAGILDSRNPSSSPSAYSLVPTFRAPHSSFQEIEELLLVRGMSPELFYGNYTAGADGRLYARGGLRDCLSVWGSRGPFDANTSSPAVLEALGVPADTVTALVARRQTRPFLKLDELSEFGPLPSSVGLIAGNAIYTLRASARLRRPGGGYSDVIRTAAATIQLPNTRRVPRLPMRILRWYDDAWSQAAIPPYPGMQVTGGNTGADTNPEAPRP